MNNQRSAVSSQQSVFVWWGVMDAGLLLNREFGQQVYAPGEIMQAHGFIGEVEVWVEWHRKNDLYRLGVGSKPAYGEQICKASMLQRLFKLLNGGV